MRFITTAFFSFVVLCSFAKPVVAAETIMVGGYAFPPFVEKIEKEYVGITYDLIEEMNAFQNDYTGQYRF